MRVGEYGRIFVTAVEAFFTIALASMAVSGFAHMAVDGSEAPTEWSGWIFMIVVLGFIGLGVPLGVRGLRDQDARWGRGLMLPTVLTVVSGLLLIPVAYQVTDHVVDGGSICIGDVCAGLDEPENTADEVALLASSTFILVMFIASAYGLLTSMREEEMLA
jgi:hypothetical protein